MRMLDYLEAAACLWEDFLARHARNDRRCVSATEDWGWSHCRITIVELAEEAHRAWEASPLRDLESFDWEFIPDWLHQKLDDATLFEPKARIRTNA